MVYGGLQLASIVDIPSVDIANVWCMHILAAQVAQWWKRERNNKIGLKQLDQIGVNCFIGSAIWRAVDVLEWANQIMAYMLQCSICPEMNAQKFSFNLI